MVTVMGSYVVEDVKRWTDTYAQSAEVRSAAGQSNVRIFTADTDDGSNKVGWLGA